MKQASLKKLYQLQGKLTKSRVLQGGAGLYGAPRGEDGVRKYSPSCGVGRGLDKTKPCGAVMKTPSFDPAPPHCHPQSRRQVSSCGCKGEYTSAQWIVAEKSGVATQIRFRNYIGPFGPITYVHGSKYQIMGPEFGYGLGRCQAPKTAWLVGRSPLYVVRPYLIKQFIKGALILNLNISHALKENKTHYMLKITSQYKWK